MLLGVICCCFPNEKLAWDGKNLRFTSNEKAKYFRLEAAPRDGLAAR
jgi:hypothetical protein